MYSAPVFAHISFSLALVNRLVLIISLLGGIISVGSKIFMFVHKQAGLNVIAGC